MTYSLSKTVIFWFQARSGRIHCLCGSYIQQKKKIGNFSHGHRCYFIN